MENLTIFTV